MSFVPRLLLLLTSYLLTTAASPTPAQLTSPATATYGPLPPGPIPWLPDEFVFNIPDVPIRLLGSYEEDSPLDFAAVEVALTNIQKRLQAQIQSPTGDGPLLPQDDPISEEVTSSKPSRQYMIYFESDEKNPGKLTYGIASLVVDGIRLLMRGKVDYHVMHAEAVGLCVVDGPWLRGLGLMEIDLLT